MRLTHLSPALLIGVAAIVSVASADQDPTSAHVVLKLPADAKLYINDTLMEKTGTMRAFYSPPLDSGQDYIYDLRAEVVRGGKAVSETKQITIRAGEITRMDFCTLGCNTGQPERREQHGRQGSGSSSRTDYSPYYQMYNPTDFGFYPSYGYYYPFYPRYYGGYSFPNYNHRPSSRFYFFR